MREKKTDTRTSYFSQIYRDESRDRLAHLHVSQTKEENRLLLTP